MDKNLNEKQNRGARRSIYQKAKGLVPLSARVFFATRLSMAGANLTRLNRIFLAAKYLSGEGIEIGALHSPLPVSNSVKVKYVDLLTKSELRKHYPELDSFEIVETDILDDGQQLRTIADSSQDFVIANHFIEHCPNPLEALKNIHRVLKLGGVFFMALPDKRFTFDVDRAVTDINHVLRDFAEGPEWSKRGHYEEWVHRVEKLAGQKAEKQVDNLMSTNEWIHFHVWTQHEMFELVASARQMLGLSFEVECFVKFESECVFILRKSEAVSNRDRTTELDTMSVRGEAGDLITDA